MSILEEQVELLAAENEQLHAEIHLLRQRKSVPRNIQDAIENWAEYVEDSIMLVRVAGQTYNEFVVQLPMVRAWLKRLKKRKPDADPNYSLGVSQEHLHAIRVLIDPADYGTYKVIEAKQFLDAWLKALSQRLD